MTTNTPGMKNRTKYSHITADMFQEELERILSQCCTADILRIPGVQEAAAEYFNNEILDNLNPAQEEVLEDNTDDEEDERIIRNEYFCTVCGTGWNSESDCEINEHCPACKAYTSPRYSEDVTDYPEDDIRRS